MAPADQSPEAELLAALSRLARKGAYAVAVERADGGAPPQYAVFSPRNGFAHAIATIPASAVACASRLGWLAPDSTGDRLRLTPSGTSALRRARSGQAAAVSGDRGAEKSARTSAPARVPQEGPLAWLRRRKDKDGQPFITEPQFAAGERLATDFWRGQLMPRVTADWSGSASSRRLRRAAPGAGVDLGDGVVAARERVYRALAAVGPELAGILLDVCCHDVGLEAAGRAQGWPQRASKVVLQLALTRLARHYGLIAPEPAPGRQRLRHWGEEGYRPTLDAWR
jgi:hypothetical protein